MADPIVRALQRVRADLQAQITEIPGGRHFVPEDHSTEVADAVGAVVANARRSPHPSRG